MRSLAKMEPQVRCPICRSTEIIEYDDYIECLDCGLEFFKEFVEDEIDDEDILSEQELKGFIDSFEEFKNNEHRKKFIKKLEDNNS
ncbi:MAG: hypothetical protein ACFFDN_20920 [Candidatus Hodarchaeota archaeon]